MSIRTLRLKVSAFYDSKRFLKKVFKRKEVRWEEQTFNMSPMLQTNDPGIGTADIQSPPKFLTFSKLKFVIEPRQLLHINIKSKEDHHKNINLKSSFVIVLIYKS